jgi:hypothetical protein
MVEDCANDVVHARGTAGEYLDHSGLIMLAGGSLESFAKKYASEVPDMVKDISQVITWVDTNTIIDNTIGTAKFIINNDPNINVSDKLNVIVQYIVALSHIPKGFGAELSRRGFTIQDLVFSLQFCMNNIRKSYMSYTSDIKRVERAPIIKPTQPVLNPTRVEREPIINPNQSVPNRLNINTTKVVSQADTSILSRFGVKPNQVVRFNDQIPRDMDPRLANALNQYKRDLRRQGRVQEMMNENLLDSVCNVSSDLKQIANRMESAELKISQLEAQGKDHSKRLDNHESRLNRFEEEFRRRERSPEKMTYSYLAPEEENL